MAISVITDEGKLNLLNCAFGEGEPFAYMAAGTGLTPPTSASIALNNECGPANGDYVRAPLTNELNSEEFYIVSQATFDTTNITVETEISEIGIVNSVIPVKVLFGVYVR